MGPNLMRFWNVMTGREAGVIPLPVASGQFATLSPDHSTLAVVRSDNVLRLYRAPLIETTPGR